MRLRWVIVVFVLAMLYALWMGTQGGNPWVEGPLF